MKKIFLCFLFVGIIFPTISLAQAGAKNIRLYCIIDGSVDFMLNNSGPYSTKGMEIFEYAHDVSGRDHYIRKNIFKNGLYSHKDRIANDIWSFVRLQLNAEYGYLDLEWGNLFYTTDNNNMPVVVMVKWFPEHKKWCVLGFTLFEVELIPKGMREFHIR